jgi:hypothetical protein
MNGQEYAIQPLGSQPFLYEVLDDWTATPLIDVAVTNDGEDCPADYQPMYNLTWYGLSPGCLIGG